MNHVGQIFEKIFTAHAFSWSIRFENVCESSRKKNAGPQVNAAHIRFNESVP